MQLNTLARLPARYSVFSREKKSLLVFYLKFLYIFKQNSKRPSDEGTDNEVKFGRYETRVVSYRPPAISQGFSSWRNESASNGSSGPGSAGQRGVNGNWRGTSEYERKRDRY